MPKATALLWVSLSCVLVLLILDTIPLASDLALVLNSFTSAYIVGLLIGIFGVINGFLLVLPEFETKHFYNYPTYNCKDRLEPCVQFWVNMLPSAFSQEKLYEPDVLDSTSSARLTLDADILLVEYPNKQINRKLKPEDELLSNLMFGEVSFKINLATARLQVLSDDDSTDDNTKISFPIKLTSADGTITIFFARGSREKKMIICALRRNRGVRDQPAFVRAAIPELSKEARFAWFAENYIMPLCNKSRNHQGCYQTPSTDFCTDSIENSSNETLNALFTRVYFDLRTSESLLQLFRENLEKQLHKIDGLIFFPNLSLSDLEFSYNPPKILTFLKPVQDNLGLWMCMSAEHVGLSSVVLNFDGRPPHLLQDDISINYPSTCLDWLKSCFLKLFSLRLEIYSAKGEVLVNLPNGSDRLWVCLRELPVLRSQVVLRFMNRDIKHDNWFPNLLYRLSEVFQKRLDSILLKKFVSPNMIDIPISLLGSIDIEKKFL